MVAICNSYLCKLYISLYLNKNLTLRKDNLFSFHSLIRFFALSFDKIGCISEIKIKKSSFFILYFTLFALSLYPNCRLITYTTDESSTFV